MATGIVPSVQAAAPTYVLPAGWTWQLQSTSSYNSGTQYTETGGKDGQTSGPYNDTSFGVMNEPGGVPWFTGNDQSDQQFIQQQIFGNYGTNYSAGPPQLGVPGTRFYNNGTPGTSTVNQVTPNNGYNSGTGQTSFNAGSTSAGANFPSNAVEKRTVTLTNWNNTMPDDSMRPFVPGMQVYVPTGGTISTSRGYGGDEMYIGIMGGTSGSTSEI